MKSFFLDIRICRSTLGNTRILSVLILTAFLAVPAIAGPPQPGDYVSVDLPGGSFDVGRFSESWVGAGTYGEAGNTFHGQSWDGSTLGNHWRICVPADKPPVLISDTRDENGTGEVVWRTEYEDGHFWLSRNGPWGDGSHDYPGDMWLFIVTTSHWYDEGAIQQTNAEIIAAGPVFFWGNCIEFWIQELTLLGDSDEGEPKPTGYPEFVDQCCTEGVWSRGSWGTVTSIELFLRSEYCSFLPTTPSTWGKIKSLYKD